MKRMDPDNEQLVYPLPNEKVLLHPLTLSVLSAIPVFRFLPLETEERFFSVEVFEV